MNNSQLYFSVGIPTLAVFLSLLISISVTLVQASGIRALIGSIRNELKTEIAGVRNELKTEIAGVNSQLGEMKLDIRELRHQKDHV